MKNALQAIINELSGITYGDLTHAERNILRIAARGLRLTMKKTQKMIETLRNLAWTGRPKPPLGVYPEDRKKRWFRWYVTYQIEYQIWKLRTWSWIHRTGGKNESF